MEKSIIFTDKAPSPIGPYSQGVFTKGTLYVSGQIAYEASLENNIKSEAKAVMKNIEQILHEANLDFASVVKTTIFLKSMDDFAAVNEVYGSFFTANFPARETVQVAKLPRDVNVEISVIAVA
jgi:2-iminobutanoate/2-iminopropanoate deaminase